MGANKDGEGAAPDEVAKLPRVEVPAQEEDEGAPKSPEDELGLLEVAAAEAESENEALILEIRGRYEALLRDTPDKKSPLFRQIIEAKKVFFEHFPTQKQKEKANQPTAENSTPVEILDQRTDLPEAERQIFIDYHDQLPDATKKNIQKD